MPTFSTSVPSLEGVSSVNDALYGPALSRDPELPSARTENAPGWTDALSAYFVLAPAGGPCRRGPRRLVLLHHTHDSIGSRLYRCGPGIDGPDELRRPDGGVARRRHHRVRRGRGFLRPTEALAERQ